MQKYSEKDYEEDKAAYRVTEEEERHISRMSRIFTWMICGVIGFVTGTGIWLGLRWLLITYLTR